MLLTNVDILIGFSTVMLGISLIITAVINIINSLFNLRGKQLESGLQAFFRQVDRNLDATQAKTLADQVLTHNLVADHLLSPVYQRATAIRFNEVKSVLEALQAENKLGDEAIQPKDRHETLFNSVMDRSSQRFATCSRLMTVIIAFCVAFYLPLDSKELMQELARDSAQRAELVAASGGVLETARELQDDTGGSAEEASQQVQELEELTSTLETAGLQFKVGKRELENVPGILISVILLSLGAPFWFNTLKNLSALRPVVARIEEKERRTHRADRGTDS